MKCPQCDRIYSAGCSYCEFDGTQLVAVEKLIWSGRKALVLVCIAVIAIVSAIALTIVLPKWFVSRCSVSLVRIDFNNDEQNTISSSNNKSLLHAMINSLDKSSTEGDKLGNKSIVLVLELANRNPLPLLVKEAELTLFVNDEQITRCALGGAATFQVPASGNTEIKVPLTITLSQLIKIAKEILFANKTIYRASGHLKLSVLFAEVDYPVDVRGTNVPLF